MARLVVINLVVNEKVDHLSLHLEAAIGVGLCDETDTPAHTDGTGHGSDGDVINCHMETIRQWPIVDPLDARAAFTGDHGEHGSGKLLVTPLEHSRTLPPAARDLVTHHCDIVASQFRVWSSTDDDGDFEAAVVAHHVRGAEDERRHLASLANAPSESMGNIAFAASLTIFDAFQGALDPERHVTVNEAQTLANDLARAGGLPGTLSTDILGSAKVSSARSYRERHPSTPLSLMRINKKGGSAGIPGLLQTEWYLTYPQQLSISKTVQLQACAMRKCVRG